MTKEELEKEAEEWIDKKYLKDMGVRKPCKQAYLAGAEPREKRIAELERNVAYYADRAKHAELDGRDIVLKNKELGKRCLQLQKDKGNLTDRVRDLEEKLANADYQLEGRDLEIKELKAQIERLKGDLELWESGACRATNLDKCSVVKELKAQIEKMKSCTNCINNYFLATEEPCCSCTRCYVRTTKKTTDKWEIKNDL